MIKNIQTCENEQTHTHKYKHSSGIEGNPTVFYRLMPGSTAQTNKFHTFYLQQRPDNGDTWADIKVNHPLDYETIKEYNLTIRVEVRYDFYIPTYISFPE
jgi:Cadherin domain